MATQKSNTEPVITGINAITSLGYNGEDIASSVKKGVTRLEYSGSLFDVNGNSLKISYIPGFSFDENGSSKTFITDTGKKCLEDLMQQNSLKTGLPEQVYLLMGNPSPERPGTRFPASVFTADIDLDRAEVHEESFDNGNPSAIFALERAAEIIKKDPRALCIVGVADCLLESDTLKWFEADQRINSEGSGRSHSFSPSQAVAFFCVESKKAALENNRKIYAEIKSIKTSREPAPYVSGSPSRAQGLTQAISGALENADPESVQDIFCDLNGEHYRSKEWGLAEIRCFDSNKSEYNLWHPADCHGNPGAAASGVLATIAAEGIAKQWLEKQVLVFASDDHGYCGAVVLSGADTG